MVRGVWVLEAVLGTPPAPPPPDVEPLSPDLRGKKTIREQLDAHRKQPACATCHQKIDPFGFPFENFDELGLWRTQYRDGGQRLKVDPSAELPDGTAVKDVAGLKAALLKKEPQVIRQLTEKLLVYGAGRRLEATDRGEVDRILSDLDTQGNKLRDLIKVVSGSKIFLTK